MRGQLLALEARNAELEGELRFAAAAPKVELHPNIGELYQRKVETLQELLKDEAARPEAVAVIRSLVERIEVDPGAARGQCELIPVSALAGVLAFAQDKTTAASGGDGGTFLMVAGTRSHLYRTVLIWFARRRSA